MKKIYILFFSILSIVSFSNNKILTSNRNLKEFLNEEEKFLFEFNERCSQIYRIKSNYDNLNYPIIFKGD